MAEATMMNSSLRLVLNAGEDEETGEPIYKSKSFNNVKTDATAEQLYEVAQAIVSLQEHSLFSVERRDNSEIRPE